MTASGTGAAARDADRRARLDGLALLLLTVLVLARVLWNGFVPYDDDYYVTGNPHVRGGLSLALLRWALTSTEAANWHPLTWLSHALDDELFGLHAAGHHATSLALHALNAFLFHRLVWSWTRSRASAFFAAALFALHPLRVESFAWVAERKDVLCGAFFLLTLLAYGRYVRRPGAGSHTLVTLALAAALAAKPMAVTTPFVLLLLDVWPHRRLPLGARRLVLEKLPWLLLAACSAWITAAAQRAGGTVSSMDELGLAARLALVAPAYLAYLEATLWPAGLACLYPHPASLDGAAGVPWTRELVALGLLLGATLFSLARGRRRPYLAVGWLWFLGMLVPVIGLVQVGAQSHADRYTYLPSLGLSLLVVLGIRDLVAGDARRTRLAVGAGAAALLLLAALSWRQIGVWRDGETLFRHALRHTGPNPVIRGHLGVLLAQEGDLEGARAELLEAARLRRGPDELANLGALALAEGDLDEAEPLLEEALAKDPDHVEALHDLGNLRARRGDLDGAWELLERALALDPRYALAHVDRGRVLEARGRVDEARAAYRRALELAPDLEPARERLRALGGGEAGP